MKTYKNVMFKLSRAAAAFVAAAAVLASVQPAYAGAGWGDTTNATPDPNVSATASTGKKKVRTYYANSPMGVQVDALTGLPTRDTGTAMRKFVDALPGLGAPVFLGVAGNLTDGTYIPVAAGDATTYPGSVYYEIAVVEYTQRMHSDLAKATTLRGYVQIDPVATDAAAGISGNVGVSPVGSKKLALLQLDGTPVLISRPSTRPAAVNGFEQVPAYAVDKPSYLGPTIVATHGTPTRLKFYNGLPAGHGFTDATGFHRQGDLFVPVDHSLFGGGDGQTQNGFKDLLCGDVLAGPNNPGIPALSACLGGLNPDGTTTPLGYVHVPRFDLYTENREELHLHGGDNPWISDGHPHQWITPAADELNAAVIANYQRGDTAINVPDMPNPGPGAVTYYWPNGQSGRLLFYHDHATGLTRLNVYAGTAAGYLLVDPSERLMNNYAPGGEVPLVIQDKTFVPLDIATEDAKWDTTHWGQPGDLWFPHVYETNQDPLSADATNPVGRWDGASFFWPVFPQTYATPTGVYGDVSTTPEAFMDTPIINGMAYPTMTVNPTVYRFRILSVPNDRMTNLSFFVADPSQTSTSGIANTEVKMVPFNSPFGPTAVTYFCPDGVTAGQTLGAINANGTVVKVGWTESGLNNLGKSLYNNSFPCTGGLTGTGWGQADNRPGGVPDPATMGPDIIRIGNESGLFQAPVVIPPTPINYEYNKRSVTVLNVLERGLWLGSAERADILVDFSAYAGKTLILYNDAGAPVPAGDPRIDYYTGDGDQTGAGGAPNTAAGYGPNIRTIMQIKVGGAAFIETANATAVAPGAVRDTVNGPYQGFAGAALNVTSAVTVSQLGRWNVVGNSGTHTVKLVDATGADVASVAITMAAASAGSFQYAALAAPVTLNPGTYYLVSSEDTTVAGGDSFLDLGTVVTTGNVGVSSAVYLSGTGSSIAGTPTWNVTGAAGNSYGPVDLKYTTGTPPAPFNMTGLQTDMLNAYVATQPRPVVPTPEYAPMAGVLGFAATAPYEHIFTGSIYLNKYNALVIPSAADVFNYTPAPACSTTAACLTALAAIRANPNNGLLQSTVGGPVTAFVESKAIQELFETDYGRMNATLGVELPFTSVTIQTTIPLAYVDPATEVILNGETQFWKITHNGVDSHPVHFHFINVQVINRVGWDGTIKTIPADEVGWKETVKMHPLEDVIVAVRAKSAPPTPFGMPHSFRQPAPNQLPTDNHGITQIDAVTGNAPVTPYTNAAVDYGSEYVWHCHILGHEENDFMRPFVLRAGEVLAPIFAMNTAIQDPTGVTVTWTDPTPVPAVLTAYDSITSPTGFLGNPNNEIGFRVERANGTVAVNGAGFAPLASGLHTINAITHSVNALANATSYLDTALPAPPAAPAAPGPATATDTTVTLTLPALPAGSSGFNVLRNGVPVNAAAVTGATYTDTGLTAGTSYSYTLIAISSAATQGYTYRVVAVTAKGDTVSSNAVAATITTANSAASAALSVVTVPAVPTGLVFSAVTANSLTAGWGASTGATGYVLQQGTAVGGPFSALPSVAITSEAVTGLTGNSIYFFQVDASNASGASAFGPVPAASVLTLPSAPGTPVAGVVTTSSVALTWAAPVGGAVSYFVQSATDSAFLTNLASTPPTLTTGATVSGLTASTPYFFRVVATNTAGNSTPSGTLTVVTSPAAPATLTFTGITASSLTANWGAVTGAISYTLQQGAALAGPFATVATVTTTSAPVAGLAGNTTYFFQVSATNAGGPGAFGPVASALTLPTAPGTPVPGAVTTSSVALSWAASPGAGLNYSVQYTTDSTFATNVLSTPPAAGTSATVSTLASGTLYYFRVVAINATGSSVPSASASATTATPATISVDGPITLTISTQRLVPTPRVTLNWTIPAVVPANQVAPINFQIFRSTNGGAPALLFTTAAATRTYNDNTVAATGGTTYVYTVTGINGAAIAHSMTVTAAFVAPAAAPANLAVGTVTATNVTLTWTAVPGATSYTLFRNGTAVWTSFNGTTVTRTQGGQVAGNTYSFTMTANNAFGSSAQSAAVTATTVPSRPAAPTVSTAGNTATNRVLTVTVPALPATETAAITYTIRFQYRASGAVPWGPVTVIGSPLPATAAAQAVPVTVTAAGRYRFSVVAVDAGGSSAASPNSATAVSL